MLLLSFQKLASFYMELEESAKGICLNVQKQKPTHYSHYQAPIILEILEILGRVSLILRAYLQIKIYQ